MGIFSTIKKYTVDTIAATIDLTALAIKTKSFAIIGAGYHGFYGNGPLTIAEFQEVAAISPAAAGEMPYQADKVKRLQDAGVPLRELAQLRENNEASFNAVFELLTGTLGATNSPINPKEIFCLAMEKPEQLQAIAESQMNKTGGSPKLLKDYNISLTNLANAGTGEAFDRFKRAINNPTANDSKAFFKEVEKKVADENRAITRGAISGLVQEYSPTLSQNSDILDMVVGLLGNRPDIAGINAATASSAQKALSSHTAAVEARRAAQSQASQNPAPGL